MGEGRMFGIPCGWDSTNNRPEVLACASGFFMSTGKETFMLLDQFTIDVLFYLSHSNRKS
jgi:hypothetical protein